ncbi:hypothetical protein NDU88_003456 [Pleurodeles waltl]|uniref:Uncharacterized protein n=1 Tax=Pleurodeles waltl TaxID=8319 RepID=A0AAV7QEY5_PLEWA|nr:hypothetical protein NDU88_003456 [Pleurodeles waltl]
MEHPLPEKIGGPALLDQEDGRGPAEDGLPTRKGCPLHHDPPDVPDPGGGTSGVGWALEGITAATRGAASVPPNVAKEQAIPPLAKVKKVPTCQREKPHLTASKGSSKPKGDSAKAPAATSEVWKGQKPKSRAGLGTEAPAKGPESALLSPTTSTSMAVDTATSTANITATCMSAASATVPSIILSGQPSEAAGDVLLCPSTGADTCTTASTSATDTSATTATSLQHAQTVPPQLTWQSSPVGSRPRLQETSWTLPSVHEA